MALAIEVVAAAEIEVVSEVGGVHQEDGVETEDEGDEAVAEGANLVHEEGRSK